MVWQNRGIAYQTKNEHDKAIEDFSEAIRLDPKDPDAYHRRGIAYHVRKEYSKAIKDYSEAIRLNPKDAVTCYNRGIAYYNENDYDRAIEDFSEAIRINPTLALAWRDRGNAYLSKKEYDKAIKDYSEAIQLNPKSADTYTNLAWLMATCPNAVFRDGKKAIEYATKACELSRWKDADHLEPLAAALAECRDFKEAVTWQKKAIELGYADKKDAEKARQRLKLYEEGKPYRND